MDPETAAPAPGLPAPPASILDLLASPSTTTSGPQRRRSSNSSAFAQLTPHSFPTDWLCSTCGATHSVLAILESSSEVQCECDSPTLQAVYDQFGRIFLYWRNDPAIVDLRDPAAVREAAWRVAEAAGGRADWLRRMLSQGETTEKVGGGPRLATRLS
jgi:hypothetical protein